MTTRKKIAIALWIFQALALYGYFLDGNSDYNLFNWIGFFLPTIIGLILWFKENNKEG